MQMKHVKYGMFTLPFYPWDRGKVFLRDGRLLEKCVIYISYANLRRNSRTNLSFICITVTSGVSGGSRVSQNKLL